ncbi:unnamed protein product [Withania somnifera]
MAIESSNIRSSMWTNVKYYATIAKKHPFVSFTLLFFILFYALSPSITWFFIYSLPRLFFFTVLLIIFFSIPNFKNFERDVVSSKIISHVDKDHDEDSIDNKQKAFLRARSVRKRKSKKCIETGAEEFIQGIPFQIPLSDHDFVDKGALIEENMKDIREVEVCSVSDDAECSSSSSIFKNSRPDYSDCSYEANGKCFKSYSCMYQRKKEYFVETEYDGARNKPVQWKDEDQKDLMDLGLSEIERTKRLESLMARRRARKMLSLQVRRSLMNIGCKETSPPIPSIVVPKSKDSSSTVSPTPGSAPSILGPNRNPFDLPYDQHEEKPNVRGGSFMQEFMSAQEQKELMSSKNESFCMETAFQGDSNLDQCERTLHSDLPSRQMFPEASESSKSRQQLGRDDNDRVVEEVPSQASEQERNVAYKGDHDRKSLDNSQDEKDGSEEQIKSVLVEDIIIKTSSSSSSEDDEPFYNIDKDAILKSIASPALRNLSGDPSHSASSFLENTREDEYLYYSNCPMHRTPGQSIASDLQVEVSEVGSPPLTNSGNSSGGEEISIDGEIQKALASSSEDTLMSSSHLARVDENESNSREVREVSEQDIVEFGFSRFHMSENNVPRNIPSERTIEPYSTVSRSFPPPRTDRNQASSSYQQLRPEGLSVVSERFQGSLLQPEFSAQQLPLASQSLVSPTSVLQPYCLTEQGSSSSIDQLQNDRPMHISSEKSDSTASQESDLSFSNSTLQVLELPSETENSVSAKKNDIEVLVLDSASEQHSENVAFSTIGHGHHSFEASSTSSSKSVSQPNFVSDQGCSSNLKSQQVHTRKIKNKLPDEVTAEICDPSTSQCSKLKLKNPIVQNFVPHPETLKSAENSQSLTRNDIQETLRDNRDEVFSTISQSNEDSQASSSPRNLVFEQVSIASTSSASPNTMIQPMFPSNEGSSSSKEQKRMQDPKPGIPSERAVNQDSISLQSTTREVPTASSCSSPPKSVLQPKFSTGQGPLLNFDRAEQIGESPSPRISSVDSAADKLHHTDAKMKPSNDEEKSHEEAINHSDDKKKGDLPKMSLKEVAESHVESSNKTTMVSSNSSTKQQKSSDVANSASSSSNKNEHLATPIRASEETSEKGEAAASKETHSERRDCKEKAIDYEDS